jgi:hypothetical protein
MAGRQWPSQDIPPIRVDTNLHLAWGLSLNLSSDENQRDRIHYQGLLGRSQKQSWE